MITKIKSRESTKQKEVEYKSLAKMTDNRETNTDSANYIDTQISPIQITKTKLRNGLSVDQNTKGKKGTKKKN